LPRGLFFLDSEVLPVRIGRKKSPVKPYDTASRADLFAGSKDVFDAVVAELSGRRTATLTHAQLEELVAVRGRELLRQLLQDHLDLRAAREQQAVALLHQAARGEVAGADGVARRRIEAGHHRLLATIVGTVTVRRCAFRALGARNAYPADAALSLPAGRHSHGLARLAVTETVRGSFDAAAAAITARCGKVIGKRQVEQLVVQGAADIDAFYADRIPLPRTAGELLVISVDGKGIVMRPGALRQATARAAARHKNTFRTRLASGEKPCRKRMATVGVVYDAEPAPRRPHDVIAVPGGRHGHREVRAGPHASGKWLCGSVIAGPGRVIASVFDHAEARDPMHARTWVVLVDGARHQLDLIRSQAARRRARIHIIIDLIHVLEYLSAPRGALLYPPRSGERLEEVSLGLMAYLALKGRPGKIACHETGSRAQAYGAACREIRVIWQKLDCLNPNLQKVQFYARRKDACNRCRPCGRFQRCLLHSSGVRGDAQRGHSRR